MDWITHQIDAIVGLGPAAIVIALGFLIVAIPLGIMALFLTQRARQNRPE
jgi:cytochrome c biogenesis protein CcdA